MVILPRLLHQHLPFQLLEESVIVSWPAGEECKFYITCLRIVGVNSRSVASCATGSVAIATLW